MIQCLLFLCLSNIKITAFVCVVCFWSIFGMFKFSSGWMRTSWCGPILLVLMNLCRFRTCINDACEWQWQCAAWIYTLHGCTGYIGIDTSFHFRLECVEFALQFSKKGLHPHQTNIQHSVCSYTFYFCVWHTDSHSRHRSEFVKMLLAALYGANALLWNAAHLHIELSLNIWYQYTEIATSIPLECVNMSDLQHLL